MSAGVEGSDLGGTDRRVILDYEYVGHALTLWHPAVRRGVSWPSGQDILYSLTAPFCGARQDCHVVNRSRRRIAGVAAASWVLATAITSLVVWRAVAAFDDGTSTNILSAPQVSERLSAATATSTPTPVVPTPATSASVEPSEEPSDTPTSTSSATSATTPTTPRSTGSATTVTATLSAIPVVKTWTVAGGTVSVSCQVAEISLVYASPQDGWRVEIEKRGPVTVEVDLAREGQGTKLNAICVNGIPQETVEANEGHD